MQTPNIHALCGIRTHDHSVRASEESSSLRLLGYCDRPNPRSNEIKCRSIRSQERVGKPFSRKNGKLH
jgi:hypothetical protein